MPIRINGYLIKSSKFPAGECHIELFPGLIKGYFFNLKRPLDIRADLHNSDDIMNLLLTVNAIKRINPDITIELSIPYFPYSRQDRVCNSGEALSVKVMTDIINSLNCNKVYIWDPHSDVVGALLNNCIIIPLTDIIPQGYSIRTDIISFKYFTLVSPDAGAEKKILSVAKILETDKIVYATKIRDPKTGEISGTTITHGDLCNKGDYVIIDDICDGGRTFIELSKQLTTHGIDKDNIYLYVTHGIFSQGLEVLKKHFKHIYCYHTFLSVDKIDKKFLTVLETSDAYKPTYRY